MQYQSPRYEGDVGKAYAELVACRNEVRASLSPETLRGAYVHFFGDLQRRTEVSLVSFCLWLSALFLTKPEQAGNIFIGIPRAAYVQAWYFGDMRHFRKFWC